MKTKLLLFVALISIFIKVNAQENDLTKFYENTIKSIVTVLTESSLGSGFFINENLVVTNYHVIQGQSSAKIKFPENDNIFDVLGFVAVDIDNDLVILKVDYKNQNIIKPIIAEPKPGTKVYSFGSPEGLEATFTDGLISALRKDDQGNIVLIQHNVSISPGSSGGPLLKSDEKLVGINVAKLKEGDDLNFAVPGEILSNLLFNMDFVKELPIEGSKDDITNNIVIEGDMEYEKRAREMVSLLGDYIEMIADKDEDEAVRKKAVDLALSLFSSPNATIEVSNKNSGKVIPRTARQYFINLFQLPYQKVEIKWSKISYVSRIKRGPDGKLRGLITIEQKFTGMNDQTIVYSDVTVKHIEILVEEIEDELYGNSYKIYLESIKVESTT